LKNKGNNMQLSTTGSVIVDGFHATFTAEGKWLVSRRGKSIGSVDMLDEVPTLITRHRERVRERLARIEEERRVRALVADDIRFERDVEIGAYD